HRSVDVRQRNTTKEPELFGVLLHEFCAVIVPGSDSGPSFLRCVVEDITHLRHRKDGVADADFVHLLQRILRIQWASMAYIPYARRLMMVMHINGATFYVQLVDFRLGKCARSAQNR